MTEQPQEFPTAPEMVTLPEDVIQAIDTMIAHQGYVVGRMASLVTQARNWAMTLEQENAEARRHLQALVQAWPQTSWAQAENARDEAVQFLADTSTP